MISPTERAELEAAIDARIATGVKAQSYSTDEDPTPPSSFAEGTLVEKAAGLGSHRIGCTKDQCRCDHHPPDPVSEQAIDDAYRLRRALRDNDTHTFAALRAEYLPGSRTDQPRIPGIGDCPKGRCVAHWAAHREVPSAKDRRRCHRCDDFHRETGEDYPPEVLRAHAEVTAQIVADHPGRRKDRARIRAAAEVQAWDHPRVHRAWDATGWKSKPGVRYPQKRSA